MFQGMKYLFSVNQEHELALMETMKCSPLKERFESATDEEMEYLCELCNELGYELINSEVLDAIIVHALIKDLEHGQIPKERLRGMYPAGMFLKFAGLELEDFIFYID